MYWQVYFHKTVVCAEQMLIQLLKRAKYLCQNDISLFTTPCLKLFLENNFTYSDFSNSNIFRAFTRLDDFDVMTCIKEWCNHSDLILSTLSDNITQRNLFKVIVKENPFEKSKINKLKESILKDYKLKREDIGYLLIEGQISNDAYKVKESEINILFKDKSLKNISEASDQHTIDTLSQKVNKFFICFPKEYNF